MRRWKSRLASRRILGTAWISTAIVFGSAAAQSQFRELGGAAFDPVIPDILAVATGDVDGDGTLDVVAATRPPVLYRGLGGGRFLRDASSFPTAIWYPSALALADVDGDGDLDAVVGSLYNSDRLLLNDGRGHFAFAPFPTDVSWTHDVTAFDADGDGDLDLAFAVTSADPGSVLPNRLYLNDGFGGFADASASHTPGTLESTLEIVAGDVDRDGDLDLFNVNYPATTSPSSRPCSLWLNDGTGRFADATATKLPVNGIQGSDASFLDVDGDGDLDLFVASDQRNVDRDTIYTNDGSGRFTLSSRVTANAGQKQSEIAVGDIDGDGDVDAILASPDGFRLLVNDGSGRFAPAPSARLSTAQELFSDLTLVDLDADGDLDALTGTLRGVGMQVNDGSGGFVDATSVGFPWNDESSYAVAAADFDGDGRTDSAIGLRQELQIVLQVATGEFRLTGLWPLPGLVRAIETPDIDRDGDPDLLIGTDQQIALWLNDGRAGFTDVTTTSFPSNAWMQSTRDLGIGDLDADGDLDIVTVGYGGVGHNPVNLLRNDGTNTFVDVTATNVPVLAGAVFGDAVALGDVDRDGDLDVVVGNGISARWGQQNNLLLNNGAGVFADATSSLPQVADGTTGVALADLNGDGAPELIVANNSERNRLHLNRGNGTFVDVSDSMLTAAADSAQDVLAANLDDDPELELVFAQGAMRNAGCVYDWTPTGYQLAVGAAPTAYDQQAIVAHDLDGDGDLDLLIASYYHTSALWWNLQRQVDAPDIAQLGRTWRLDIHAADPTPRSRLAFPLLSLALAPRPIPIPPLGLLFLEPSVLGAFPPVAIPHQAPATVPVAIPAIPALAGLGVHAQALVLVTGAPLTTAHLTNLVTDRMIR